MKTSYCFLKKDQIDLNDRTFSKLSLLVKQIVKKKKKTSMWDNLNCLKM